MLLLRVFLVVAAVPALCAGLERRVLVDKTMRIINGTAAPSGKYPSMVSLQRGTSHWCGCTIVTSRIVVTAAHCSTQQVPFDFSVLAGTVDVTSGGQRYPLISLILHPNWDNVKVINDLAVGKTATDIVWNYNVAPAKLPGRTQYFNAGSPAVVMGWGETGLVGGTKVLLEVGVTLISEAECDFNMTRAGLGPNPPKQTLCVVPPGGGTGKGNCFGDSGGPLVINGFFAGVSSFHIIQCGVMSGFTRVANYVDWIMCMAD